MINRRHWLQSTAVGAALLCTGTRLWAAHRAGLPRLLVVFLRGGYDATNVLVPHGSPFYYASRPTIAVPRPGTGEGAALEIDALWGLAPALREPLGSLLARGELAFVPFAGTHDASRSHFETQDTIELGSSPGAPRDFSSGFLNRLAAALDLPPMAEADGAMAFTDQLPLVLRGTLPVANLSLRSLGKPALDAHQAALIEHMYAPTIMASGVRSGFEMREEVAREMAGEMEAANRNAIATKGFELEARRIARLMRDQVALGFVDVGGWDTHVNEGGATGVLATRLSELGRGLAAFSNEMGATWRNTVVVVLSEFGRTFRENGDRGTDHGHGTVYWVLGGGVRGGVRGEQVNVEARKLFQNRDYPVLNEYRALLGGLFRGVYGLDDGRLAQVFPGVRSQDLRLV
jgi:uncharacterized protein (DUF1501 family)